MLSDDFGHDHDLVLLNAICHMFSEEQNRALFRRAYEALGANGRLVVQDFILETRQDFAAIAALFALEYAGRHRGRQQLQRTRIRGLDARSRIQRSHACAASRTQ